MKRFTFTLEPILRYREELEQVAQRAYAEALAASEQAANALKSARADIERHWLAMRNLSQAGSKVAEFEALRRYGSLLEERQKLRERQLEKASLALVKTREELKHACQQRQILDRLREHQHKDFVATLARADQKQMDEFAMIARGQRPGASSASNMLRP